MSSEASSLSSSSSSISLPPPSPFLAKDGVRTLDRIDRVQKIITVAAISLFFLSIALLSLAQARKVSPFTPLYSLGAFALVIPVICLIHKRMDTVAKQHGLELDTYYKERLGKK